MKEGEKMSGKQVRKTPKRFAIVFYGDEGPQKITVVEATNAKRALSDYFSRSGANQFSLILNRTRALEEKTFVIKQDGSIIGSISAVSTETALAWYAEKLHLNLSFVKEHCLAEEA